jgi:hypothetical protein
MRQHEYKCPGAHRFFAEDAQEQPCPVCGGKSTKTGRWQDPDLHANETQSRGGHSTIKAINSTIAHRLLLP